jgi:hypothetical protein
MLGKRAVFLGKEQGHFTTKNFEVALGLFAYLIFVHVHEQK